MIETSPLRRKLLDLAISGKLVPKTGEWKTVRIGDVMNLQAGKNISAQNIHEAGDAFVYPCYGGNGIRGYVKTYNTEGLHAIIGRQGALCGNLKLADGKFYATEHAVVVEVHSDVDMRFAYWALTALNLNQYATATAQPGLSVKVINDVAFPLPPLAEQKAVVKRLEELLALEREIAADSAALDDLIATAKRKILDLAISSKLVPKTGEWKTVKLGDIALVSGGTTPKSGLLAETGIPYFKIAEMNLPGNEKYLIHTDVYVSKLSRVKTFPKGSIVFPKNGGALLTNKKRILGQESVCDLNTGAVILKDTTLLDWVYLWFQTIDFSDYVSGGVIPTINGSTLKALSLPLPPLAEQKAIVAKVEELFAVLDAMKGE